MTVRCRSSGRRLAIQCPAQVRLAPQVGLLHRFDARRLHHDVGFDPDRLDRAAGGRVVAGGREAHCPMPGKRDDRLHRALAERFGAEHDRSLVVLQGSGDDLRRRSRAAIDQDYDRQPFRQIAGLGVEPLCFFRLAGARRDDLALVEEVVGDGNRLRQQTSRIVAQIENDSLQRSVRLPLQLLDLLAKPGIGLFAERTDADVADLPLEAGLDRLDLDHLARERHLERLTIGAADRQFDRAAGAARASSRPRRATSCLESARHRDA